MTSQSTPPQDQAAPDVRAEPQNDTSPASAQPPESSGAASPASAPQQEHAPREAAEVEKTAQEESTAAEQENAAQEGPAQESAARQSSAPESDAGAAERRKIKIGSQREGSPKIRMQRRHFVDTSLEGPAGAAAAPPAEKPAGEAATSPAAPASPAPSSGEASRKTEPMPSRAAISAAAATTALSETPQPPAATPPITTPPIATPPIASQPAAPVQAVPPQAAPPQPASIAPTEATQPPSVAQTPTPPATTPAEAAAPQAPPPPKPRSAGPVSVPRLTAELDEEVEAALGGMSLDQIIAEEAKPQTGAELEPETRRRGIVLRVHREDVFFSLGVRHEGIAALKQFAKPPEPGDQMDVIVARFNGDEGLYDVTIPGAAADVGDWGDVVEGSVVEARVTGSNTGGLECQVNSLRGFIPASQISLYRVENLGEYVGQKLLCVITEANPERRNLVLSHRAVLEREKEEARQGLLDKLEVGQLCEGTVRSLRDFGAFVDIGGIDGLVHISKLSWDRVNHPSDVLQEGQRIKVKIEKIDRQSGKIGLSYRDTLEDPWDNVEQKYPVGSAVEGTVSRVAQFGAFVKLEPGVEGLVHVSELAHHRVSSVGSYVKEGQQVQVKVLSVDRQAQRIGLSMKALVQVQDTSSKGKQEEEEEAPRELAVPKRKGPLKGGLGRSSGGEQFGLNW